MKEHLKVDEGEEEHLELSVETCDVFNNEKFGFRLHTNQLDEIPIIPYTMYIMKYLCKLFGYVTDI